MDAGVYGVRETLLRGDRWSFGNFYLRLREIHWEDHDAINARSFSVICA